LGTGAIRLQSEGHEVLFAYEEALGYCVGSIVHDKDGISGAIAFMDMVNTLHAKGMTLSDYLESLYAQYGQFQSHNSYAICHDPVVIRAVFERLRTCGSSAHLGTYIDRSGSVAITSIRDITRGVDLNVAPGTASLPATPESEMLMFAFENGSTVTLRTSGTEPKIKYYIEMGGRPGMTHDDVANELAVFAKNVVHDLLRPDLHKLE
jgi:phosphomannomutase